MVCSDCRIRMLSPLVPTIGTQSAVAPVGGVRVHLGVVGILLIFVSGLDGVCFVGAIERDDVE